MTYCTENRSLPSRRHVQAPYKRDQEGDSKLTIWVQITRLFTHNFLIPNRLSEKKGDRVVAR